MCATDVGMVLQSFTQATSTGKFSQDLQLGSTATFYLGLDGVIGLPRLKFLEAIQVRPKVPRRFSEQSTDADLCVPWIGVWCFACGADPRY